MVRQKSLFTIFLCIFTLSLSFIGNCNGFNCHLPNECRLEKVYRRKAIDFNERGALKYSTILCDVKNEMFEFKLNHANPLKTNHLCDLNAENVTLHPQTTILRWLFKDESAILNERFNFTNVIKYFSKFKYFMNLNIHSVNGFGFNLFHDDFKRTRISYIELIDIRLEFYHNKKKINSCQEIFDLNLTAVKSIFQIPFDKKAHGQLFILRDVEYKTEICPLVFENVDIENFMFSGLVNTFYKKNVLKFEDLNYTASLNSRIKKLQFNNVHDIVLDLDLLNPLVFSETISIIIQSRSLNSINEETFRYFKKLLIFELNPTIFRKINHRQGINWIRNINYDVRVDLNKFIFKSKRGTHAKYILISDYIPNRKRISKILADEDFCIYVDFPFSQLVIFMDGIEFHYWNDSGMLYNDYNKHTCTYLWLIQYSEFYYKLYSYLYDSHHAFYFLSRLNSTEFKSISKCDFEKRKNLCNKSNYQTKDIWDESDYFILNKKFQIAFKLTLYPIAFLCFSTNLITILVILKKENSDLLKKLEDS